MSQKRKYYYIPWANKLVFLVCEDQVILVSYKELRSALCCIFGRVLRFVFIFLECLSAFKITDSIILLVIDLFRLFFKDLFI